MYSQHHLKWNRLIKAGVWFTLVIYFLTGLLHDVKVMQMTIPHISIGLIALFVVFCWGVFERWAWTWPFVKHLSFTPNLNGRWKGKRLSTVDGKETEMVLEIKQTLTAINCWTYTQKGNTWSYAANLLSDPLEDSFRLTFVYHQESKLTNTYQGDNHDGFFMLRLVGLQKLEGSYANDRDPHPAKAEVSLIFEGRNRKGEF